MAAPPNLNNLHLNINQDDHAAAAALIASHHQDESSWKHRTLQALTGASTLGTLGLLWRLQSKLTRLSTLQDATPIDVEQLPAYFEAQQRVASSSSSSHSRSLPPQYLAIRGVTSCSAPIETTFSQVPHSAIWYSKLETQTVLKMIPWTTVRMMEEEKRTAYFETRDFELVGRSIVETSSSSAVSAASATAASSIPAAVSSSSSSSLPLAVPTAVRVSIPSSLPADPHYFHSLLRQVSDAVSETAMSSSHFLESMSRGRVKVRERNIEKIVPVGESTTVVGWVHRDDQGNYTVLPGQNSSTSAIPASPWKGATPVMVQSDSVTSSSSSSATSSLSSFSLSQPDLAEYSYSSNDHPCIITSKSHARLLEDECASVSSTKKWILIGVGVTFALGLAMVIRHMYKSHQRQQELQRLLLLQATRKERREAKRQESKAAERRRVARANKIAKEAERIARDKEMEQLKWAQLSYFNAVAAAAAANSNISIEGMPHPPQASPRSSISGPASSSSIMRQTSSPLPPTAAISAVVQSAAASSSSSSAVPSYASRAPSPFQSLPPRPPSMARTLSPFTDAAAIAAAANAPLLAASSSSSYTGTSSSSSSAPHALLSYTDDATQDDDDAYDSAGSGSLSGHASDDEASSLCGSSSDDGGGTSSTSSLDYCVICAESKADACILPCAHMYTCVGCAGKLKSCPICRRSIDSIVKVFAQQL